MDIIRFFGYCFVVEIGIIITAFFVGILTTIMAQKRTKSTYKSLIKLENKMKNQQEEFLEKLFEQNPELYKTLTDRMKKKEEEKKKSDEIRDSIISNGVPQDEINKALESAIE
ncbi:MAG: hypothetical protein IJ772_05065 [Bacilli bacterium]|nr:hypothetical protein [Bacilli bacterium]